MSLVFYSYIKVDGFSSESYFHVKSSVLGRGTSEDRHGVTGSTRMGSEDGFVFDVASVVSDSDSRS